MPIWLELNNKRLLNRGRLSAGIEQLDRQSLSRQIYLTILRALMTKGRKQSTEQSRAFIEAARALGCEEDEAKFNAALGKVARHKPQQEAPKKEKKPA
jgi:hypothetical protein